MSYQFRTHGPQGRTADGRSQESGWEGIGRERKRGKGKKGEKRSKREKLESLMEATMGMDPKYGVRSPKFIWAPCAQLYSLAETTQLIGLETK